MKPSSPLADLFAHYQSHKLRGASPGTLNQFRVSLRNLAIFLGRPPRVSDLSDTTVLDAMYWMIDRGRKPATANRLRSNLLALWRYACRRAWLRRWPDAEKMREPERIPVAWTRDELRRLWGACETQVGSFCGVPCGAWWSVLHSLAWDGAERINAILCLRREDVSLSAGTALFRAESRKGRTRDRLVRLHGSTVETIRTIWRPERALLLPWPFSRCYLWLRYGRLLRDAGLPHDRAHKFHAMRRSAASWYEAAGGNATELLDHASRSITVKHYLDVKIVGAEKPACDVLFRPTGT